MRVHEPRDMRAAYDLATALRPSRRNELLQNQVTQVMSLADGRGMAVMNDLGVERVVAFDRATGMISSSDEDLEPILPPHCEEPIRLAVGIGWMSAITTSGLFSWMAQPRRN